MTAKPKKKTRTRKWPPPGFTRKETTGALASGEAFPPDGSSPSATSETVDVDTSKMFAKQDRTRLLLAVELHTASLRLSAATRENHLATAASHLADKLADEAAAKATATEEEFRAALADMERVRDRARANAIPLDIFNPDNT